jgi:sulfotransferase family protein
VTARRVRLVYLASSARSGSTIFDMMLGAHSSAFSLGQIDQLEDWIARDDFCTCGRHLGACPLWGAILGPEPNVGDPLVTPMLNVEGQARKGLAISKSVVTSGMPPEVRAVVGATWRLLDRVAERTGAAILIDSSKSLLRLARLDSATPPDADVRVVHLVRDLRGVIASRSYSKAAPNAAFEIGYTPADSWSVVARDWWVQNLLALILGTTRFRRRYLVVTYEHLVADPTTTLDRVARFLGVGFEPGMLPPMDRAAFHLIGGNSSRLAFDALRPDDTWKTRLSRSRRRSAGMLQWPLYRALTILSRRPPTTP